ncbi:MAG: hypothetical protein ACP5N7_06520 [Candidatus Pacearchaeota archaeon]
MQELNNEKIINEIIINNYATTTISIAGGKIEAIIRTLPVGDQLEVEDLMSNIKDKSQLFILHQYSLLLLSRALLSYNNVKFDPATHELTYDYLQKLPSAVIDILVKSRDEFQTAVMKILVPSELEKHFFPVSSSEEESKSSLKDTSSKTS